MIITAQTSLLLTVTSSLLFLSLHFLQALAATNCTPSSCGIITNISPPFRLNNTPSSCGDPRFELSCENDVASIYLNSQKFYVKEINYLISRIRLVDASISNETCSFPNFSASDYNFTGGDPYRYPYRSLSHHSSPYDGYVAKPINLIRCPNPLKNSSFFTDFSDCRFNFSTRTGFDYIRVGRMNASEVPRACGVDRVVMTSWEFRDLKNVSISEIHESLLYGFELYVCSWWWCSRTISDWEKFTKFITGTNGLLLIPLAILVFIVAGVSLPVTIIIGVVGVLVLSFSSFGEFWPNYFTFYFFPNEFNILGPNVLLTALLVVSLVLLVCLTAAISILASIILGITGALVLSFILIPNWSYSFGASFAPKFIYTGVISSMVIFVPRFIICPFVVWFLIYKFRRRRFSDFDVIESYLQSDNKLAPIRYSYSDLKRMTKGFQEKLGEGGFGAVYKGKLRSGHHVAVKLLGKAGANGKDFINEISTTGRIHHVNVVQLVGYCAEGSKRALVYDFMPNGSLEKYLFNREKTSSLSWETKFEIAVGAARGIEYLHQGCDVQILHFDIKPHNILLDDNFVPKISDFGLAKLYSTDKNAVTMTAARGTIGYVAPELISRSIGAVSYKADVYSFGMLLVEMVGLNRDLTRNNGGDSNQYFPNWIYDSFEQGRDIELARGNEYDVDESTKKVGRKMTIVALWCILMNPDDRPPMHKVLEMLEGDVERLQIPDNPLYSNQIAVNVDQSEMTISSCSLPLLREDDTSSSLL